MGPTLVRHVPSRSDLAISCWKAQGWLVWAVHEDEGSRVTGCGHMWCPWRWETAPLLPGVQVECLRSSLIGPASSLFPFPVQVLPIVVPRASATLVVCRREQQRTRDQLRPSLHRHGPQNRKAGRRA